MDENMQHLDEEMASVSYNSKDEIELPSTIEKSYIEKVTETMTMDYYFQDKRENASMLISAQKANIRSKICSDKDKIVREPFKKNVKFHTWGGMVLTGSYT